MSLAVKLEEQGFAQTSLGKVPKKRLLGLNAAHCWAAKLAALTEKHGPWLYPCATSG